MTDYDELHRAVQDLLDSFYDKNKRFSFNVEVRTPGVDNR